MIKKVIAPLVLTGALFTLGNSNADASDVNFDDLAYKVQHNSVELNQHPIQEGAYDYKFVKDGIEYHFYSDGAYFGYTWKVISSNQGVQNTQVPQTIQESQVQSVQEQVTEKNTHVQQPNTQQPQEQVNHSQNVNKPQVTLSNGNTAGATGSSAAKEMEARTGVSASTWEAIIARESNGQVNAQNPSGARGLFQTMPGWGSTATVQDQINSATKAYKAQGLSAWGM